MIIDRAAITLKVKQPAVDWINKVASMTGGEKLTLKEVNEDSQLYLIPDDVDYKDLAVIWVYKNAEALLVEFMNSWYQDESLWPTILDIDLLEKWFDIGYHSLIIDTVDGPINKEEK